MCSGAILSSYQRSRVESCCERLGLASLAYMWQREQGPLLDEMIANGIDAVLVKVASLGLTGQILSTWLPVALPTPIPAAPFSRTNPTRTFVLPAAQGVATPTARAASNPGTPRCSLLMDELADVGCRASELGLARNPVRWDATCQDQVHLLCR